MHVCAITTACPRQLHPHNRTRTPHTLSTFSRAFFYPPLPSSLRLLRAWATGGGLTLPGASKMCMYDDDDDGDDDDDDVDDVDDDEDDEDVHVSHVTV